MTEKNSSSISISRSSSDRRLGMLKSALAHCPDAALMSSFSLYSPRMVIFSIYYRLMWRWELRHHHDSVWDSFMKYKLLAYSMELGLYRVYEVMRSMGMGKIPRSVRISPWRRQCLNIDNSTWRLDIWVIEGYWWKGKKNLYLSAVFSFHKYARTLSDSWCWRCVIAAMCVRVYVWCSFVFIICVCSLIQAIQ